MPPAPRAAAFPLPSWTAACPSPSTRAELLPIVYFAYGSNLWLPRLLHRVPGARMVARAVLAGYEPRWHKRGSDESGKLSILRSGAVGSSVWGAVFSIPPDERPRLDRIEGLGHGYERARVTPRTAAGSTPAWTYVAAASHVDEALRPYTWYRDLVVSGVEAVGAPERYVGMLRSVDARKDPDSVREGSERRFLA